MTRPLRFCFSKRMGLPEVNKYIKDLRKKQSDPGNWPDYLTGLPGKSAILHELDKIYPKLGRHAVAYVRIANIYPYLIKYGYSHHADLIEWSAAILKTTAEGLDESSFVGTINAHDYIIIAKQSAINEILEKSQELFAKKAHPCYTAEDRKKGVILSFEAGGKVMRVGLMKLIFAVKDKNTDVPRIEILPYLAGVCSKMEKMAQA